jgi:hypothetical protein
MKVIIYGIFFSLICGAVLAQAKEPVAANVRIVKGTASIIRNQEKIPVKIGDRIFQGDVITTSSNSAMGIVFKDNSLLSIGSDSKLLIDKFVFKPHKRKYSMVAKMIEIAYHGEGISLIRTKDGVAEQRNRRVEVTLR